MNDLLALVGSRKHRLNLASLQELVRLATTRFRLSRGGESHLAEAMNIILQKLQTNDLPLNDIAPRADKFLTFLRQAPPKINKRFFYYGVLDTAIQVTRCLCPSQALQKELEKIIFESNVTEYRFKAVCYSKCSFDVLTYIKTGRVHIVFSSHAG